MKHLYHLLTLICVISTCLLTTGCGESNSSETFEGLEVTLAPGKLTYENSGSADLLFASVKGTGIAGGEVKDKNGNELGVLSYVSQSGAYELTIERAEGGFIGGKYTLIYRQNADTFEKEKMLIWNTLQPFIPAPSAPKWDQSSKNLTLNYSLLPGTSVNYHLRLYSHLRDDLILQSAKYQGPVIVEHVSWLREYRIHLVAEVLENNEILSTIRHIFSVRALN